MLLSGFTQSMNVFSKQAFTAQGVRFTKWPVLLEMPSTGKLLGFSSLQKWGEFPGNTDIECFYIRLASRTFVGYIVKSYVEISSLAVPPKPIFRQKWTFIDIDDFVLPKNLSLCTSAHESIDTVENTPLKIESNSS
mmetsp:Transcript_4390/g.13305  ORF Transcript_4390/g.13305 Transcript_4390/m.13305 type:complete len:136 (+) Transcript_4390:1674-2081(+)